MRWLDRLVRTAALLALAGCAYPYTPPALPPVTQGNPASVANAPRAGERPPVTILVSIDGFRPDYLERGVTPTLSRLAREGATGPMRPSFPTKTFPNHWTLVTGLVPDRHGIVGNAMEDPARPGETFTMATDDPFWWNAAEPIWATAERAGIRTATEFWPGASVAWGGRMDRQRHEVIGGARPSDWHQYAEAVTDDARVDAVVDWMRRPAATRPRFVTLYFDTVDTAGHQGGPDSPGVATAAAGVDRAIGRLMAELATLGQRANLVIVADHGMIATSPSRIIAMDRIAPLTDYRVVEAGPYAAIAPLPGREASVAAAFLRPRANVACWRKADIPPRLRYGRNPRVTQIFCLADPGWLLLKSAPTTPGEPGGMHGYDDRTSEMRALFIAHGPAFRPGARVAEFANTDIAPLLRDLLGLPPGIGLDGSAATFGDARRR